MPDNRLNNELIKKYQWAGKIRLISFALLFVFLLLMKLAGGYSYLNPALFALIFVEALLNQPYGFLLKRTNIYRFQFYQMFLDIVAISWVLYYMGGIEAPVVSVAYYAVILWAGVVAGTQAVFFAVIASSFFMSVIVLLQHFGVFVPVSFLHYNMPIAQALGLLIGNISFLFAFGYFSARSSAVIQALQKKRQEESLRSHHRLLATGYLLAETAHDLQGCLAGIRGNAQILLELGKQDNEKKEFLKSIERFEQRGAALIHRLAKFSQKSKEEFKKVDAAAVIESALELTEPLVKYSHMTVEKKFGHDVPAVIGDKDQLQEVFLVLILNALDAVGARQEGGALTIQTRHRAPEDLVEVIFSDTGIGMNDEDLRRLGEPFFSTKEPEKGAGLGLAVAYDLIARHGGKIDAKGARGKGATFTVVLPSSVLRENLSAGS